MQVYIETYGCAAAKSDSEIVAGLLTKKGHKIINNTNNKATICIDGADAIIITTCDVKLVTEQKITNRCVLLAKQHPSKKLILVGCMVDNRIKKLRKLLPNASFVSTHRINEISQAILSNTPLTLLSGNQKPIIKTCLPRIRKDKTIGIVQISEGCRGACTFCSTRLAKGTIRSFPMDTILKDISNLVKDGCTKIYLTSQDTAAYGYDLKGKSLLPELLEKISAIKGDFITRVGMMNPDNMISSLPDFIKAYKSDKIMKFLHLPVQSGSNSMLKIMNRRYTTEQFKQIISAFRESYPNICLWTDIIIGYPGETEQQFKSTLKLLTDTNPNYANVSRFARRENTEAAKLKQFNTIEMKRRTRICNKLVQQLRH
jgi:threonylcarbamoyladenosine tRNA methylthiotransferase CDKAL1